MYIVPAILPQTFEEIISSLFQVEGLAKRVQIDVCDGKMGIERTWLPHKGETLPNGFIYEFDVMLYNWQEYVKMMLDMGAQRIVAHVDAFTNEDFDALFTMAAPKNVELGLAVSNGYPINDFISLVHKAVNSYPHLFVQVMGIKEIGAQGQPFDEEVLSRIIALKKDFPMMPIQVDGSMNVETAKRAQKAGADTIIVGSYIFKSKDVKKSIEMLEYSLS